MARGKKISPKKNPCVCLTCADAKPFDDGQKGLVCDVTLEACFMDCDDCASWSCNVLAYAARKAQHASRKIHVL